VTWIDLLDRTALGISACVLLLVIGLARSWSLCRSLRTVQAELREQLSEQVHHLGDLQHRLDRLEEVSSAQEADERIRHDDGVVEILDSLLHFNESLRVPSVHQRDGQAIPESPGEAS
jgi:hypothetical protein